MLDIVRSTRALDPPPTVTLLTEADDEVVLWDHSEHPCEEA